jgi:uncharacterized repeat protein (TIGR01451 family)
MLKAFRIFSAAFLLFAFTAGFAGQPQQAPAASAPLAFEINRGQTAPQVQYLARSREGVVFLTSEGLTVSLPHKGSFRLLFANASSSPSILAEQPLASHSNYLNHAPGKSVSNVGHFSSIIYRSIYPGIDVRFYARGQHLEHDFLIGTGADPEQIELRMEGIDHATITSSGAVELSLGKTKLYESAPIAWQEAKGVRRPIHAEWKLLSSNRLGVSLSDYDHTIPLTIDPVLAYSTHLGGTTSIEDLDSNLTGPADTFIEHIAMDGAGNVYVAGSTSATDFPTTAGAFDRTFNIQEVFHEGATSQSGFVSKFDKTGRILIYSTYFDANVSQMTVDASGHVYVAEDSQDAFPGPNPGFDSGFFIDKLSPDGSKLLFAETFAASPATCATFTDSSPRGIAADNSGNLWVTGITSNPCFPITPGVVEPTLSANNSASFLIKLNTNVSPAASLVYATYVGSASSAFTSALTVDSSGNAYVAGFALPTYPHSHTFGAGQPAFFVTKFNPTASARIFSTFILGISDSIAGIALDPSRNVYIAGATNEPGFPTTPSAFKRTLTGRNCAGPGTAPCQDGFVTKLNATGSALSYSTLLGGAAIDVINGLRVNSAGMAFVTGSTASADYPVSSNGFGKHTPAGGSDAFVTALNPNGQSLYYSALLGGSSAQNPSFGNTIFVDPAWNAWVGGTTGAADFPVTPDAFQPGRKGTFDGFISKIVIAGNLRATMTADKTAAVKNSTVTFFAQVTNLGPDGSDNVVLLDPIPAGYSFIKIFSNSVTSCAVPAVGATTGTVNCKRTRLEKGQTMFVNIYLKAIGASGSVHANKITTSAQTQDLTPANNSASVNVSVK